MATNGKLPTEEQVRAAMREIERYKGLTQQTPIPRKVFKQLCDAPIDLPEATSGEFSIKKRVHRAGETMCVCSQRNALMMGYRATDMVMPRDRIVHQLIRGKSEQLMVSDTPQEMFTQYDDYMAAWGHVLVGGLGLGMYANMVAAKPEVTNVTVVEIEQDVINLVAPYLHPKVKVIHADLWKFLRTSDITPDYIYIDIYYSTGETEYLSTVLPIRKILFERFFGIPASFWLEREMEAQFNPQGHWAQKVLTKMGVTIDTAMTLKWIAEAQRMNIKKIRKKAIKKLRQEGRL